MRELDFSDGFSSASEPSQGVVAATKFNVFANDAAFVAFKGSAAATGDAYFNSTVNRVRVFEDTEWVNLPDLTNSQTALGQWTFDQKVLAKPGAGGGVDATSAGILEIGALTATEVKLGKAGATTTVVGDLVVSGDTTTVNTATLDVEDKNITVNNGGNDATAEGAGLTVDRTGTSGSLIYAAASASKFKIGDLGAEIDVVSTSAMQTLTNKSIDADANTITNIEDADIKTGAAISRAKLASGSANHVLINDGTGVMSSEATLEETRGGTGNNAYAVGDILRSTVVNELSRLPIGASGEVLTVVAGVPAWVAAGAGGSIFGITTTDLTAGNKTVASGTTLFYPYPTIDTPDTYTIDGRMVVVEELTVNGEIVVNGELVVLSGD